MDVDETFRVGIEADTGGLDKALGEMTAKANNFGAALNGALRGAVTGGRSLDAVFRQLGTRLSLRCQCRTLPQNHSRRHFRA